MEVIEGAGEYTAPEGGSGTHWTGQLRSADLSVGTYCIAAGGIDDQDPHTEDEIYLVTAGRASFEAGGKRAAVGPGTVLYVPAGEVHAFTDVTEDLAVVVVFAPPEGANAAAAAN